MLIIHLDVKYKKFKQLTEKGIDAWVEVLIFDRIAAPISYLLFSISKSKRLPYMVTILSFLLRAAGGGISFPKPNQSRSPPYPTKLCL